MPQRTRKTPSHMRKTPPLGVFAQPVTPTGQQCGDLYLIARNPGDITLFDAVDLAVSTKVVKPGDWAKFYSAPTNAHGRICMYGDGHFLGMARLP